MFGFSKPDHRTAIAVDIGSSSVGVAIVCIYPDAHIENIWEHREYCVIHDSATASTQIRQIRTAIANAFLELGSSGLIALKKGGFSTDIQEVQAIISAPWSYTITKTISLNDEKPFTVTEEMIAEMVESAKKKTKLVLENNKLTTTLGLDVTHGQVINVAINEYPVTDPVDQEGTSLSLSYVETAISQDVTQTLEDTVSKLFPKAAISQYSFMFAFYLTMRNLRPNTYEICLIDITGEATEIGIVREDVLQHTTFIPAGTYSLARELAKASGVPKEEAYGYMKDDPQDLVERLPQRTQEAVRAAIEGYQEQVSNMFSRTGDKLTIPKTIFLHTDLRTQEFFNSNLVQAAKKATGAEYAIHPVTSKILGITAKEDTALLLSINFLAKKDLYTGVLPKRR